MSCLAVSLFPEMMSENMKIWEYAALCKNAGLDGFDLGIVLIKNHTPVYLHMLTKAIADAGLPLTMITASPDFAHPDPLQREREFDFLSGDIAIASALKAKFLRVTAGQAHPSIDPKKNVAPIAEYLLKAASVAHKYGIELLFENHSINKSWHYSDIAQSSRVFLDITERIWDSPIGINFDTANLLAAGEDNTIEVLDKVMSKVRTVHVADISEKGSMNPVQLGTGIVPLREIFQYLKEKKFDGWLCLEIWKDDGVDALKRAVHTVKETWEKA